MKTNLAVVIFFLAATATTAWSEQFSLGDLQNYSEFECKVTDLDSKPNILGRPIVDIPYPFRCPFDADGCPKDPILYRRYKGCGYVNILKHSKGRQCVKIKIHKIKITKPPFYKYSLDVKIINHNLNKTHSNAEVIARETTTATVGFRKLSLIIKTESEWYGVNKASYCPGGNYKISCWPLQL